jgi:stage IV sporulation protein FB
LIKFTLIGKIKITVDFTFFVAIALFFYFDESGLGIIGICACAIHEIGHLIVLYLEKKDFDSMVFYGGGIKIKYKKSFDATVFAIMAGSLLNIIIFTIFYFLFPDNAGLQIFAVVNLVIGIFNLLPVRYFDGGFLLEKILIKIYPAQNALKISRNIEKIIAVFGIIVILFIFVFYRVNLSALLVIAYVIFSDVAVKLR